MTQPHPQRCETCTNDECDFNENRWGSTWHNDIYYFMKKCGCASHSSVSEPVPEPNPCEENGCTDIEICDEICEHMRIYSPAYVRESRQKARAEVLDELAEPTIRASEESEKNGLCKSDLLRGRAEMDSSHSAAVGKP